MAKAAIPEGTPLEQAVRPVRRRVTAVLEDRLSGKLPNVVSEHLYKPGVGRQIGEDVLESTTQATVDQIIPGVPTLSVSPVKGSDINRLFGQVTEEAAEEAGKAVTRGKPASGLEDLIRQGAGLTKKRLVKEPIDSLTAPIQEGLTTTLTDLQKSIETGGFNGDITSALEHCIPQWAQRLGVKPKNFVPAVQKGLAEGMEPQQIAKAIMDETIVPTAEKEIKKGVVGGILNLTQ